MLTIVMSIKCLWTLGVGRARAILLLACACLGGAAALAAAADAPSAPAEQSTQAIPAADIPARADADEQSVYAIVRRTQAKDEVSHFEQTLAKQAAGVQDLAERTNDVDLASLSVRRLESLQRHWHLFDRAITHTRAELSRAINLSSEDLARLASRREAWQATRQTPGLAPALMDRVDELIAQIEGAEKAVGLPLGKMLGTARKGNALSNQVQAGIASVSKSVEEQDRRLLIVDMPPLWRAMNDAGAREPVGDGLRKSLAIESAFASDYDAANLRWLPALVGGLVLLLPALVWLRHRARVLVDAGQAPEPSMRALSRPWAAWLLLVFLGAMLYDIQGPNIRQDAVMLLAWIPILALVQRRVLTVVGPWAYLSAMFYFLNVVASLLLGNQLIYRGALLGINLLMLLTLAWRLIRDRRQASQDAQAPMNRLVSGLLWLACAVLLASVGSNVVGNVSLATMLTGALLDSSYVALAMYAGSTVLVALLQVVVSRPALSRMAGRRSGTLIPLAARLWHTAMVAVWAVYTLQAFRVYRPLFDFLVSVLTYTFNVGSLSLSLGGLVSFAIATWAAFWLAKTIRSLLAEDLLPSLALPRGVGNSISTLSYYSILFVGLLMALAAAGIQLGQLAIVFGALGVGIGFGLQDVVRNFVAGMILMFERPIQPGDVVDVAQISGTVRDIGMRATIVRTFDGADVVVPNGMLVADKLVNWTFTGTRRRVNIDVSTAYSVDPQRTINLLIEIASKVEGVSFSPAPFAILTGLAPGALEFNLRAWTTERSDWVDVRSRLAVKVNEALAEAGIEVPMPQRDLRVRMMSKDGADGLDASRPAPAGPDAVRAPSR
jgi:small-conductance mechanosensitive channel